MAMRSNRVGDILLKAKLIDPLQLRSALARHDQWGGRLAKIVVDLGFAPEDAIVDVLAKELFLKRVQLGQLVKDAQALRKVDARYCEEHAVFPVSLKDSGKTLVLAMADPTDLQVVDEVAMKARARVLVMCAGEGEIQTAVARYYHDREPARAANARRFTLEQPAFEVEPVEVQRNGLFDSAPEGGASAGQLLEEILSPAREEALAAEALARLEVVRENQEKSSLVLRALTELLEEKGALQSAELHQRLKA